MPVALIGLPLAALHLGLACAQERQPTPAPVDPLATESLLRVTGALVGIVLLVFAAAWLLRRIGQYPGSGQHGLRVVAGLALGQRERVVVLQVGEEQLLIGVAPGRIQTLHRLAAPLSQADATPGAEGFAAQLAKLYKRGARP